MSIRHGLLALLGTGPMYGYQLRAVFEAQTRQTWPLNIGQVYTTLARLQRDGLVHALPANEAGQRPFEITGPGRDELARWFASPVPRATRGRDELAIKVAVALVSPGADVPAILATQRAAIMDELRDLNRTRLAVAPADLAQRLVLDAQLFQAEAEVRWLDHCENVLSRTGGPAPAAVRAG
ncbi:MULTISPECIES: PadR family transcriptional regulator [unclassified Solwaraspora]|uniref:PadR family transcriptional regulator n=1 Tax=unclassified Solwaraspora TaxID=2627926 RepID=UPI00259BB8AC|nr:PadR family transcriptional regulator [Solwaraspora sp. WMMA2056]WJK39936.1 PadR family transcriptional regulator [Solwaraspora sp. WMMA2056]